MPFARFIAWAAVILCGLVVFVLAWPAPTPPPTASGSARSWQPSAITSWTIQLSGRVDESVEVDMYVLDPTATPAAVIRRLKAKGRTLICYLSAGAYEAYRGDADRFPASLIGRATSWPGEYWLDIRRLGVLGPILEARLEQCRAQGFDGVAPDYLDGYTNETGFPLTEADQLVFNRAVAQAAHARGLVVGLRNAGRLPGELAPHFEFALIESCFLYHECDLYQPFVELGKPVFEIEYELALHEFCPQARALHFRAIKKSKALDASLWPCS